MYQALIQKAVLVPVVAVVSLVVGVVSGYFGKGYLAKRAEATPEKTAKADA